MSGFTNNLSNLPPGCTDADIERAQEQSELAPGPGSPLPCPFCGNRPVKRTAKLTEQGAKQLHWVDCATIGCCLFGMGEWTEEEAVAKWNRRVPAVNDEMTSAPPTTP